MIVRRHPDGRRIDVDVDVLCVGSGPGILGAGIALAQSGMRVLIAHHHDPDDAGARPATSRWSDELFIRWGMERWHRPTMRYLDDLTDEITGPEAGAHLLGDPPAPLHVDHVPKQPGKVPPFVGSTLRGWSAECLRSSCGTLSTRVLLPGGTGGILSNGARVEVHGIAEIPQQSSPDVTLWEWLLDKAVGLGVVVRLATPITQLLFEEGEVTGAVLSDVDGPRLVRARRGVVLGTGNSSASACSPSTLGPADSQLCLVSMRASRFGRLAVLDDRGAENVRTSRRFPPRRRASGRTDIVMG
jgi:hypothetical protein